MTDTFSFYDNQNSTYLSVVNPSVSSGNIGFIPTSLVVKAANVSISSVGAGVSFPNIPLD